MDAEVKNLKGETVKTVQLPAGIFEAPINVDLMHQALVRQLANARLGTHSTKTRQFVRGGGKKPYRQKGTGNARQGSSRAPNFVGGGKVFGPHPRSYDYTLPRKVKKAALASALSLRAQEKKLVVVDKLVVETPRSKRMADVLKALGFDSALVVDTKANQNLVKSIRNLAAHACLPPEGLNVFDILNHGGLVITQDVVKAVEARVIGSEPKGEDA